MSHGFECHSCGRFRHDFFSRCACGFDFRHRHDCHSLCHCRKSHRRHDCHSLCHCRKSHRRHDCHSLCECRRFHHRDHHSFDRFHHKDHSCFDRHIHHKDFCDDRFNVRLKGIDGGLAFRLRQLIGCVVKLEVECGNECNEIRGIICHVGRDFVEVEKIDKEKKRRRHCRCKGHCDCKHRKDDFLIIPLNEIKVVKVDDDDKKDCC